MLFILCLVVQSKCLHLPERQRDVRAFLHVKSANVAEINEKLYGALQTGTNKRAVVAV